MTEIDYEELIRSPLDDLDESTGNGWSVAVLGAVLGLGFGFLLTVGIGGGSDEAVTTITTPTTAVTLPEPIAADYPPGYSEIAPGLAVLGHEVILDDEVTTVAFTSAVKRGEDPVAARWPAGGTWILETGSGTTIESARVVVGRFSPGAFAIQFPTTALGGETDFNSVRVVERWDVDQFVGSVEIPFGGEPFTAPEVISVPVNQEITLIIPELELGRFLGSVEWRATGAESGASVRITATLLDADGEAIGSYSGFPEAIAPSDRGVLEIFWSEPFPTDQEGAVAVSIDYTIGVVTETPVSIAFDLTGVPVGR